MMGVAQGASCIMSAGERRARFQTGRAHEANIYIGLTLEGQEAWGNIWTRESYYRIRSLKRKDQSVGLIGPMFETWYVCSFAGLVNALADLSMLGDETEREAYDGAGKTYSSTVSI